MLLWGCTSPPEPHTGRESFGTDGLTCTEAPQKYFPQTGKLQSKVAMPSVRALQEGKLFLQPKSKIRGRNTEKKENKMKSNAAVLQGVVSDSQRLQHYFFKEAATVTDSLAGSGARRQNCASPLYSHYVNVRG